LKVEYFAVGSPSPAAKAIRSASDKLLIVSRALSLEKAKISVPLLVAALFYDLSSEKTVSIPASRSGANAICRNCSAIGARKTPLLRVCLRIIASSYIYGPYSAAYAGNSIGAVVNITTRLDGNFAVKEAASGQPRPTSGSYGMPMKSGRNAGQSSGVRRLRSAAPDTSVHRFGRGACRLSVWQPQHHTAKIGLVGDIG
jgi:hypothetical protein